MSMAELVRQQRHELYGSGHQNLNMALPEEMVRAIDRLKQQHRLRSRDAVVARILRKGLASIPIATLMPLPADPEAKYCRISPIVAAELVAFVRQIQGRFRLTAYGPVFEMVFAAVGDDIAVTAVNYGSGVSTS